MKYIEKNPKPPIIEAITFDRLIEYGKTHGANMVDGMPWSFEYEGYPVTHETDEHYLIIDGANTIDVTPGDMLIIDQDRIYTMSDDVFPSMYEPIEENVDGIIYPPQ